MPVVFFFLCVCASSSLLQVHLCPLYPFLLFCLSSWFLLPSSRATHATFSWIILSVPVLGSGWLILIASPLPSISLASFGFNTFFFFFKEKTATCAVWFYPLIPLTLPTRTLYSIACAAASPFPCFTLSSFENFLCYTERFGVDITGKYPRYTLPWLTCYGWDVAKGQQGIWAFPQPLLQLAFIDWMLPLHKRASLPFGYDFLNLSPPTAPALV